MRSLTAKQRQCICSAFFTRDVDFERHLSDHAEQQRVRERMIGDLQAEAIKHKTHADADDKSSPGSDIEQNSESDGKSEGTSGHSRRRRLSEALVCPSCPRSEPFAEMHKLRRHHEQDTECHEVCVFCHESFKRVRKFKRHRETCSGDSELKRAYMDDICKQLTILSNTKLEKALRERKKRSRDESEQIANPVESSRRNGRAQKRKRTRQQHADNASGTPNPLSSYAVSTGKEPYSAKLSGAPAAAANVYSQNQTQSLSTEANEAAVPSVDMLDIFDAPLVHVMNSVPPDIYPWSVNPYDGNLLGNDPAAYSLP